MATNSHTVVFWVVMLCSDGIDTNSLEVLAAYPHPKDVSSKVLQNSGILPHH